MAQGRVPSPKGTLPDYLLKNYLFYQFFDKFSALWLYKINDRDIFDVGDVFQIFDISWSMKCWSNQTFSSNLLATHP